MHQSPKARPQGRRKRKIGLAGGIFLWGVLLMGFPVRVAPVRGASMEPTLHDGQWLAYERLPWTSAVERGEVVVFRSPIIEGQRYVKRVVGLEGDELRFEDGELRVNGEPLPLPIGAVPGDLTLSVRVPDGSFYAIGDHGAVSLDCRSFGPVPMERLLGRVLWALGD